MSNRPLMPIVSYCANSEPPIEREHDHLLALKRQIETGHYYVDCHLVADAILRRLSQGGKRVGDVQPRLRTSARNLKAAPPRR